MKTVIKICCALIAAISLGETFLLDDFDSLDVYGKMSACEGAYKHLKKDPEYGLYEYPCYEHSKIVKCLKRITTSDSNEAYNLARSMKLSSDEVKKCPGFVGVTDTCRARISDHCKSKYEQKLFSADDNVCDYFDEAIDCLQSKLNDTCTDVTIQEETARAEQLNKDCKSGEFFKKPCNEWSISKCRKPVRDYMFTVRPVCEETLLANALRCFEEKEEKCVTSDQQNNINSQRDSMTDLCNAANGR